MSTKEKEAELRAMQEKYGVDGAPCPSHAAPWQLSCHAYGQRDAACADVGGMPSSWQR